MPPGMINGVPPRSNGPAPIKMTFSVPRTALAIAARSSGVVLMRSPTGILGLGEGGGGWIQPPGGATGGGACRTVNLIEDVAVFWTQLALRCV